MDNLSNYPNLNFLIGSSPEELQGLLAQIKLPFKIVAIYAYGAKHIAWVNPTTEIIKVKEKKKSKE